MSTNVVREPSLSPVESLGLLERFKKVRLRPSLKVWAWGVGGTFVFIDVSWTTPLASDSLRVTLDGIDVTKKLTIDDVEMKASGTVDAGGVGIHVVDGRGEFLASLFPVRTVVLTGSAPAYCPS
jgi:hypothetical protein